MEFTGPKCHFYHFRWNGNAEIRLQGDADRHEGGQCARQQGLHHRPELQLGPRRAEADARICRAVRLYGRRRRDPRREQDPGFRALRRQDQGGGARHGGHGQLVQRPPAADEGRRRFRTQGALSRLLDRPAGQHRQRRRHGAGALHVSTFFADANGEKTAAFAEDFKAKTGQYP